MGKFIQMIAVLTGVALASGLALGMLNTTTKDRIANNILKYKKIPAVIHIQEAMSGELSEEERAAMEQKLLAEKRTITVINEDGEEEEVVFFVLEKDGRPYAVTIEGQGKGFGGDLGVMAGFKLDGSGLAAIGITTHAETPGVGSRVTEEAFLLQFQGMNNDAVFKVKKDGGDIDAVTGATISSRAVAQALQEAKNFYQRHRGTIEEMAGQPPPVTGE